MKKTKTWWPFTGRPLVASSYWQSSRLLWRQLAACQWNSTGSSAAGVLCFWFFPLFFFRFFWSRRNRKNRWRLVLMIIQFFLGFVDLFVWGIFGEGQDIHQEFDEISSLKPWNEANDGLYSRWMSSAKGNERKWHELFSRYIYIYNLPTNHINNN